MKTLACLKTRFWHLTCLTLCTMPNIVWRVGWSSKEFHANFMLSEIGRMNSFSRMPKVHVMNKHMPTSLPTRLSISRNCVLNVVVRVYFHPFKRAGITWGILHVKRELAIFPPFWPCARFWAEKVPKLSAEVQFDLRRNALLTRDEYSILFVVAVYSKYR